MNQSQFTGFYKHFKVPIQKSIDEILRNVNFSDSRYYKYDLELNGILINQNGKWIWSWMNTINTNYSCIFLLIEYVNDNFERKISLLDFKSEKVQDTLKYFHECLYEHRQKIFTPKSDIFKNMFFTTQNTWNKGIVSTISSLSTITEYYGIDQMKPSYHRGVVEDMCGIDMILNVDGNLLKNQHKSCDIELHDDYYVSKNFIYNELTYRKNLDTITIDYYGKIYFFRNSLDKNLIKNVDNSLYIHKNQLINIMDNKNTEITDLLMEMNKICFHKQIVFVFEVDESNENRLEESENGRTIVLYLNNVDDKKIIEVLKEKIKELQ